MIILQADHDIAPLDHVAAMARRIPGAQLVVLPGSHRAYLGEATAVIPDSRLPAYATGIILEFLDGRLNP